ncbi:hypothetical protein INR49_017661 [Caranx melampygus]|nr:hypothetical protein INR49_017661 [Caranx melampygus]
MMYVQLIQFHSKLHIIQHSGHTHKMSTQPGFLLGDIIFKANKELHSSLVYIMSHSLHCQMGLDHIKLLQTLYGTICLCLSKSILLNKPLFCRDLSHNPIINMSNTVFQGFVELNIMIVPGDIACPGGNASWSKVEVKYGNRICKGQKNVCNQTGQLSMTCPENSLCAPYGPGLFECSCADNYHGYKCLREGQFPALQVFGPLGASTVMIAFLLWVTQRRKAKSL